MFWVLKLLGFELPFYACEFSTLWILVRCRTFPSTLDPENARQVPCQFIWQLLDAGPRHDLLGTLTQ